MKNANLNAQIQNIVESCGCKLYDIEIVKENDINIFRISIWSPNGVTHEHCERVSEIVSPLLDVCDPIDGEYFLEVSSPGLERNLKKPNHFMLSINEEIEITLNDKTKKRGRLTDADECGFSLDSKRFEYKDIKKAKSVFEF